MLFVIPRSDGTTFRAAHEIDSKYDEALKVALSEGVEIHAWRADVTSDTIFLSEPVPCV